MQHRDFKLLGYMQLFIGMSAATGGLPLILSPDAPNGLTPELLQNTPFTDFLLPGLILFGIGLGNLVSSFFSLKVKNAAGILGIVLGGMIILWMAIQLYYWGTSGFLQYIYLLIGATEIYLGLRIQKHFTA